MSVKTGTAPAQFLFWEYMFPVFGIGSLQCASGGVPIPHTHDLIHSLPILYVDQTMI
jgi:hypothetical protein